MNLREILEFRRDFYRFLSSLFAGNISKDFLMDLWSGNVKYPRNLEMAEGFRIMEEFLRKFNSFEEAFKTVEDEFVRFFSGISTEFPTTKSEFFGEGAYGEISLKVEEKMRSCGYVQINRSLPPDHIAVELDFMAALIDSYLSSEVELRESLLNQLEFLEKEILSWIPKALEKLEKIGEFYRGVAKVTAAFLKFDKKVLREVLLWED